MLKYFKKSITILYFKIGGILCVKYIHIKYFKLDLNSNCYYRVCAKILYFHNYAPLYEPINF